MRIAYAFLFLALLTPVLADSFTLYSGDSFTYEDNNFTVAYYRGDDAALSSAVIIYSKARTGTDFERTQDTLEDLLDELEAAKFDDRLKIVSPFNNLLLDYDTCAVSGPYTLCFDSVTYYEEDVNPLGDDHFNTVRNANGTFSYPVTLTIEHSKATVKATRTFSDSTVYINEPVDVKLTLTNTGDVASPRLSINDGAALTIHGTPTLAVGSLAAGDTKQTSYTAVAKEPGIYTFSAITDGVELDDSTLTVYSPVNATFTASVPYEGEPVPINLTIVNTYTTTLTITGLDVISTTPFLTHFSLPGQPASEYEKRFSIIELEPGENVTLAGVLAPGAATVTADFSYSTIRTQQASTTLSFTPAERTVTASALTSGNRFLLTINNTYATAIKNIIVSYDDNETRVWGLLKAETEVTLERTYEQFPDTIALTVTYTYNGTNTTIPLNLTVANLTETELPPPAEPPVEQPPTTPETPAPPVVVTEQPKPIVEDGRSVVQKFLDWLENLF
jgi:hypothetical protein